jgi:hypothetical protein
MTLGNTSVTKTLLYGNIEMQNTTSSARGGITKNNIPFLHNFKHPTGGTAIPLGKNLFLGLNSGNFTVGETAATINEGSLNVGIGDDTLKVLTTGYGNVAVGIGALMSVTTGNNNLAFGAAAIQNLTTGIRNTGVGYQTLQGLVSGSNSTAIGYLACTGTGGNNTVLGALALFGASTYGSAVSIGYQSMRGVLTGSNTVAIGFDSCRYLVDGVTQVTNNSYSTYIGNQTRPSAETGITNEIAIGNAAVGKGSNTAQIGGSTITDVYLQGKVHSTSSMQVGDDSSTAALSNVGALRYRVVGTNSYVDMVMQISANVYSWVNIVQNNW